MKIRVVAEFEIDTKPSVAEIKQYVERGICGESIGFGEEHPFYGLDENKVIVTEVMIKHKKGRGSNTTEYFDERSPS